MTITNARPSRRALLLFVVLAAGITTVVILAKQSESPAAAPPSPTTSNVGPAGPGAGPTTRAAESSSADAPYPPADPGYSVPAGAGDLDGPITDQALQTLLDQDSDLEPALRLTLNRMGAQAVFADLTTHGAAELARTWIQLWPAGPPTRPSVADFHLHAISARSDGASYRVLAIYSGKNPVTGEPIDHQQSTVRIEQTLQGYQPVSVS